jgi:hypothetical protein
MTRCNAIQRLLAAFPTDPAQSRQKSLDRFGAKTVWTAVLVIAQ